MIAVVAFILSTSLAIAQRGSWKPVPAHVWEAMRGKSWHANKGCPSRKSLALLSVPYRDFSGAPQTGELIAARSEAGKLLNAFAEIYRAGFRISKMRLFHRYDGDDDRSMADNNTSAFNYRLVSGGTRLSEHSHGKAIDINPVQNPYVTRTRTLPPKGAPYDTAAERKHKRTGMIRSGDPVVKAFSRIGWKWGGNWRRLKDYQHFSKSGR